MKRVFIEESTVCNFVKIIDTETQTFHMHNINKELGCPFGVPMDTTVQEMGFKDMKDCIKQLKHRGLLPIEVEYKDQMETERIGLIKLGVYRILLYSKSDGVVNCDHFKDVCEKLTSYGMNFVDAQNQILGMYESGVIV